jgi:hypothetical protein
VKNNPFLQAILITAFLALAVGPSRLAQAQDSTPGLSVKAQAAYQGYFKYGQWLPIWVELENEGSDLEAEVQVQITGSGGTTTYAAPVSLPSVSRKRLAVYVLPNNFSRELQVQVVSQDELLASQMVQVRSQPNINYLVGLIAPERGPLALLTGIQLPGQTRTPVLVDVTLEELPSHYEALRSFDALVIDGVDTSSLAPEQTEALEMWVRSGGRLVIGGGSQAAQVAAGLPQSLLLYTPQEDSSLEDLEALSEYAHAESVRVPGPFIAATGQMRQGGKTLAQQDQVPLVVEKSLGEGSIDQVALGLRDAPFDAWNGTTSFWESLISPGAAYPSWLPPDISPRQQSFSQIPYALSNLPALDLPSVRSLAFLLGFYILVVGPLNYLFLRRRKRLHLAWVTIPLITAVFTAGAFGVGYAMRGSDMIYNKIALIEPMPGGGAHVTSFVGIFSPGRQVYEIEVDGGGLVNPLTPYADPWSGPNPSAGGSNMVFIQGDPGRIRGLEINQWSMQSFMTENVWPDFGQVSSDLRLTSQGLSGSITNHTDHMLKDAVVILGRNFTRLGDIAPGQEVQVSLDMSAVDQGSFGPPLSYRLFEEQLTSVGPGGPSREAEQKRVIIDSLFNSGSVSLSPLSSMKPLGGSASQPQTPLFLGWTDAAPPQVSVAGKEAAQHTTALLTASLPYQLPESGQITLPPGLIPGEMVELPAEGGPCGEPSLPSVYIARGQAVFDFQIPDFDQGVQVERLNLSLTSEGSWLQAPEVALYDWEQGEWGYLSEIVAGINPVGQAQPLVSDSGLVRVRLAGDSTRGGCYMVSLGLEGRFLSQESVP